jgi:hypothetical protein
VSLRVVEIPITILSKPISLDEKSPRIRISAVPRRHSSVVDLCTCTCVIIEIMKVMQPLRMIITPLGCLLIVSVSPTFGLCRQCICDEFKKPRDVSQHLCHTLTVKRVVGASR